MPTPCRYALVAVFLIFLAVGARAEGNVIEREVKVVPGRDARVSFYSDIKPDCMSGPLPSIRLVLKPEHGTVTVKRGTLKATNFRQCLALELPALAVFYRGIGDYVGADQFLLEIGWPNGRKELQHFRVNVSPNPGGGQGI
jgi:hypothetical protein